jgi:Flp pilus assembly protein TadG
MLGVLMALRRTRLIRPRSATRFRNDTAGVSAVEFALVLPVMLILWAGMAEMAHAIDNWRKVTQLARTVVDLTSQGDTSDPIASATMNDILASATAVLRPFASTNTTIVVSALGVDTSASTANPRVCSSIATGPSAQARKTGIASDLTIPAGFGTNGNRYVLAEVSMPYSPMLGATLGKLIGGLNGTIRIASSFAWPVRTGVVHNSANGTAEVTMPGGSACP